MSEQIKTRADQTLDALVASLGVGVFALDADGALTYANERALRTLGVDTGGDHLGLTLASLADPSRAQAVLDSLRAARRGYRVRVPWAPEEGVALVLSPTFDHVGSFDGVAAHVVEGGRSERALARARSELETFRRFFDSSIEGIALMGPDYRIERANRAFCELIGRTEEDLTGRTLFSLARENGDWEDTLTRARCDLEAIGATEPIEGDYTRGDGSVVPLDVRAWRVYDPGARSERVMATARDASTRRRAARRARNASRVAAARARFARDERAAAVALELATSPTPEQIELLEFASSRAHIVTSPIHVDALASDVHEHLLARLDDPSVLDLECSSSARVDVDVDALRVSVAALTDNALAASNAMPELTLRVGDVDVDHAFVNALSHPHSVRPGPHVFIELSDHGDGMRPETLEHCVALFFSTSEAAGLGLAAVNAIARAHSGGLHVSSSPRAGTTVSLILPSH